MDERIYRLANELAQNNVRFAFGVAGSGLSWDLITQLESLGVEYTAVSHEAAAAIMAGTVNKTSNQIAISISIKGPGLLNMLPGIAHNVLENNAAISISEAYGDDIPVFKMHKRFQHDELLSTIVKCKANFNNVELGTLIQKAKCESPGPIHIDLCAKNKLYDESPRELENFKDKKQFEENKRILADFLECLNKSNQPVIIVGSYAIRSGLQHFLQRLRCPVFTTAAAKGIIDERERYSAGVFTGTGRINSPEYRILPKADLIISIGLRNTEVISPVSFEVESYSFDEVDSSYSNGFNSKFISAHGNDKLWDIIANGLSKKEWGMDEIQESKENLVKSLYNCSSWLPAHCFDYLNTITEPYGLVVDTGSFCTVGEHVWQACNERIYLGSNNGRYMGVAIPTVISASITNPNMPMFCIIGDGGIRMYFTDILLAVDRKLPICFLLMSDGKYGSIACTDSTKSKSLNAVTMTKVTWWQTTEAMGCESYYVGSVEDLQFRIENWVRLGPLFLEANFDAEEYSQMVKQVR